MSNVFAFPSKDDREWENVEKSLAGFLLELGASNEETHRLLLTMRVRWNRLYSPVKVSVPYSIPGPITDEQAAAINAAVLAQIAGITEQVKEANANTLVEFALLEYRLL